MHSASDAKSSHEKNMWSTAKEKTVFNPQNSNKSRTSWKPLTLWSLRDEKVTHSTVNNLTIITRLSGDLALGSYSTLVQQAENLFTTNYRGEYPPPQEKNLLRQEQKTAVSVS